MSPFSQLQTSLGYGNGIDRDFSPIMNYIDEFDRHFSRRHRFMNCFIPRFDLEEDAHNYYLYGDIPGATVNDITVEAHDDHTLVVYGKTFRPGPERNSEEQGTLKVGVEDREHGGDQKGEYGQQQQLAPTTQENQVAPPTQNYPPPPTQPAQVHPHHQRHGTTPFATLQSEPQPQFTASGHRILLSERLVGDFTRTFAFPTPVIEAGVQASMENGVLSLVVPKKEKTEERKTGRKIPILKGGWWKAENGLHGENEPRGRAVGRGETENAPVVV